MANPEGIQRALEIGMAYAADQAETLRRKAAAPLKPRKPQAPCDVGLFSDEADQLDLVEMCQDPVEMGDE